MSELDKALAELTKKKCPVTPIRELKSGKEAKVWVVTDEKSGELYALKVYHDFATRSFQTQKHYLEDRFMGGRDRVGRAVLEGTTEGRAHIQATWVMREQYFLKKISAETELVPKMIKSLENGVLTQFIGDENGAAPRMSEIVVPEKLVPETVGIILDHVDLFLYYGIIHGDLSPFNILWWHNMPYFIDFPQAVDVRESKRVYTLLKRDVKNVMQPFGYDESEIEGVTQQLLERHHLANYDL